MPPNLVRTIGPTYTGTKSSVVTPEEMTDELELLPGALQGDTLAPFLIIIVLDFALREATNSHKELGFTVNWRRSRRTGTEKTPDLDFVDNIALFSDGLQVTQKLPSRVGAQCRT